MADENNSQVPSEAGGVPVDSVSQPASASASPVVGGATVPANSVAPESNPVPASQPQPINAVSTSSSVAPVAPAASVGAVSSEPASAGEDANLDKEVEIKGEKTVEPVASSRPNVVSPSATKFAGQQKSGWLAWLIAVVLILILAALLYLWVYPTFFSKKEGEATPATSSKTETSSEVTAVTDSQLSAEISNLAAELNKVDEGIASNDDNTSDL